MGGPPAWPPPAPKMPFQAFSGANPSKPEQEKQVKKRTRELPRPLRFAFHQTHPKTQSKPYNLKSLCGRISVEGDI
jgi:hypothetical protein